MLISGTDGQSTFWSDIGQNRLCRFVIEIHIY